jgi:hypothetical protein
VDFTFLKEHGLCFLAAAATAQAVKEHGTKEGPLGR